LYSSIKTVGATPSGGLWALEWALHTDETNFWCPSIAAFIVPEIIAFIRTNGQTDMARSTRLVVLIKNIYTLWGRKLFLLPITHFPTNLPVTGIKMDGLVLHSGKFGKRELISIYFFNISFFFEYWITIHIRL